VGAWPPKTFVCPDCGADVPLSRRICPACDAEFAAPGEREASVDWQPSVDEEGPSLKGMAWKIAILVAAVFLLIVFLLQSI
jgi:hypothetical protein